MPAALAAAMGLIAGRRAGVWQLAAAGVIPIGEMLKRAIGRRRPLLGRLTPRGGTASGPSFPSTHVANYVSLLGFAAWLLGRVRSPIAIPTGAAALAMIAAIGPSRVATGDHRWSDVVGGYVLGTVYLAMMIVLARRDRNLRKRPPRVSGRAAPGAKERS